MDILDDLGVIVQAVERLEALLRGRPQLDERIEILEVIKATSTRAVFDIKWRGKPAVAKMLFAENRAAMVSAQTHVLNEIKDRLEPPAYVPKVIHIAPKAGLFVLEKIDGTLATDFIRSGDTQAAMAAVEAACLWLKSASGQRKTHVFDPKSVPYLRPERFKDSGLERVALAQEIAEKTRALIAALPADKPITQTMIHGHGDLSMHNLIIGADRVTAIDLAPYQLRPMAMEIAQFAIHCARHHRGTALRFGILPEMYRRFAALLGPDEAQYLLPIYYGAVLSNWVHAEERDWKETSPQITAFLGYEP